MRAGAVRSVNAARNEAFHAALGLAHGTFVSDYSVPCAARIAEASQPYPLYTYILLCHRMHKPHLHMGVLCCKFHPPALAEICAMALRALRDAHRL